MVSIVTNNREVLLDPVGTRVVRSCGVHAHGSIGLRTRTVEWLDYSTIQLCLSRYGCPWKGAVSDMLSDDNYSSPNQNSS